MARTPKPWYWEARDGWYVGIRGKRVKLADGKANRPEAVREFHRLMADPNYPAKPDSSIRPGATVSLGVLLDEFLIHARGHFTKHAFDVTRSRLVPWALNVGLDVPADQVGPIHVDEWLRRKAAWSRSTRDGFVRSAKRLYSWGMSRRMVDTNPLAGVKAPGCDMRDVCLTVEAIDQILAVVADAEFRDLLTFLRDTGCRPSEAYRLEARHIDLERKVATLHGKTTTRTGKPRVIYLSDRVSARLAELMPLRQTGPIFRNTRGNPWTESSVRDRFHSYRARFGFDKNATACAFRKGFVTDALVAGVPIAAVAELAGHVDTTMISRHYSKLGDRREYLAEQARKVRE